MLNHDSPYIYRARWVKVIDGDTIDVEFDLGFHATVRQRVRLLGCDTPELRDKDPKMRVRAQDARTRVVHWLTSAQKALPGVEFPLLVTTDKSDSFGRYLANVLRYKVGEDPEEIYLDEVSLTDHLLANKLARPWGTEAWPWE